jgi:hypothetical protein
MRLYVQRGCGDSSRDIINGLVGKASPLALFA